MPHQNFAKPQRWNAHPTFRITDLVNLHILRRQSLSDTVATLLSEDVRYHVIVVIELDELKAFLVGIKRVVQAIFDGFCSKKFVFARTTRCFEPVETS